MTQRLLVRVEDAESGALLTGPTLTLRGGAPPYRSRGAVVDAFHPRVELSQSVGGPEGEFQVPDGSRFLLRFERSDCPGMPVQVEVDVGSGRRPFPNGAPAMMALARPRRGSTSGATTLTVRWSEPREVVLASGQNAEGPPHLFRNKAMHRFDFLIARGEISRSTVLTSFHCTRDVSSGRSVYSMTHATFVPRGRGGGGAASEPAGQLGGLRSVLMTREDLPDSQHHVETLYRYLANAGQRRPGRIVEVGFLGHAYWMGAVLFNTGRRRSFAGEGTSSCSTTDCHEHCPIDRPHAHLSTIEVPDIRDGAGQRVYGFREDEETSEGAHSMPIFSRLAVPDRGLAGGSRQGEHRRSAFDRDPRNTDFCDDAMLPGIATGDFADAMHAEGTLRVWGCNNGMQGGAFRNGQRSFTRDTENQLLDIRSSKHGHGGRPTAHQRWRVRQGDFKLLFLSRLRRGYAAALAKTFERPCYGSPPGTWGAYDGAAMLGALRCMNGSNMRTLTRWGLHPAGLPRGVELEDAAGYFRCPARPDRVPWTVRVLVTGFLPFMGRPMNTSGDIVAALQSLGVDHVRRLLGLGGSNPLTPPWLEVDLQLLCMPTIDVVFSCPNASGAGSQRGADQILGQLGPRGFDADLVVIVGEAGSVASHDFRLERFARNNGNALRDNSGGGLVGGGPLFPTRTHGDALESTVPLRAWCEGLVVLQRAGLSMQNGSVDIMRSAGEFVCNESFYTMLLEARGGLPASRRPRAHDGSGRWVQMIHVKAMPRRDSTEERRLAEGLGKLVASYVLSMTWAGDIPGDRVTWSDPATEPPFPSILVR